MSAKLEQALSKRQVLIRKKVSGEVIIHFASSDIKDIILSHSGVLDLLSRRGVTIDAVRASNVKKLIDEGYVEVLDT